MKGNKPNQHMRNTFRRIYYSKFYHSLGNIIQITFEMNQIIMQGVCDKSRPKFNENLEDLKHMSSPRIYEVFPPHI